MHLKTLFLTLLSLIISFPALSAIDVNNKGYICHTLDETHGYKSDAFMAIFFEDAYYYLSIINFKKNKKKQIKFNLLSKPKEKYYVYGDTYQSILLKNKKLDNITLFEIDIFNSSIKDLVIGRKLSCKGYHLKDVFFEQLDSIEKAIQERKFKNHNNNTYNLRFKE